MIYIDLDNCLIDTVYGHRPSKRRKAIRIGNDFYSAIMRPSTNKILEFLRGLDKVCMVTTATRDYAHAMNDVFCLGFGAELIKTREDIQADDNGSLPPSLKDEEGILIDNMSKNEGWARAKMSYIGMDDNRYFQIRSFNGRDPDNFNNADGELDKFLRGIKKNYE